MPARKKATVKAPAVLIAAEEIARGKTLSDGGYKRLRSDLEATLAAAQQAAQGLVVHSYWQIGKRISQEKLSDRANYAASILVDLSADLGVHVRTLQYAVRFHRLYPELPKHLELGWAQVRELLALRDDRERAFYQALAQESGLTRKALAAAIRQRAFESTQADSTLATRSGAEPQRARKGKALPRPKDPTFVYEVYPRRVIDGDTLLLDVDLGFEVVKRERIRLASVDAPPLKTKEGKAAFVFLRDRLAQAEEVVIKTHRVEAHGRYVADVFYSTRTATRVEVFAHGRHLNQELIDRGLGRLAPGP